MIGLMETVERIQGPVVECGCGIEHLKMFSVGSEVLTGEYFCSSECRDDAELNELACRNVR